MAPRTRGRNRSRPGADAAADTPAEPGRAPIPPGWPGEDPTLPDDLGTLGGRPARSHRRPAALREDAVLEIGTDVDTDRRAAREPHRREHGGLAYDHPRHEPFRVSTDLDGRATVADRRGPDRVDADGRATERRDTGHADTGHADDGVGDSHDDELDDDDLDLIAGVQPAGRVLVVMVAALVLAMLVNADALVERAERKPPGAERDRSLAIWHPVQDVSHVLQLYRVRQLADWIAGDDDDQVAAPRTDRESRQAPGTAPADPRDDTRPDGEAPVDGDRAVTLRTPTEDDPLRLLVAGDFTAQVLGDSLGRAAADTGVVDATVHYESASGLTRKDYFDWPAALDEDLAEHESEVVVLVVGVNDAQGIVTADGTPAQLDDPRWGEEYHRRVGALMDQLRADDRLLVWVGQPPMRDGDFAARMAALNQVYATQAADRPWVTFVDPAAVVGGAGGVYSDTAAGADGAPVEVRQPDGIHLTSAGGDLIAAHVIALLGDQVDLGEASGGGAGAGDTTNDHTAG